MATTKAGSIYAEVRARLNKYEADLKKAGILTNKGAAKIQRRLNKISFSRATQSMAKFSQGFMRLQGLVGGGFAAYGIGRMATQFIDVAASFEQMEAKLDILTQGRGVETLEQINKWALDLPVSTKKAVDSFVLMQAMGLNPTIERMQVLADVAAVMGDDALPRLSLQLGQAAAKGKIMQQDLNIMGEAGINAARYLREEFGMTVQELQKSGIDIQTQLQAIFDGMAKDFEGSTARMAKSWNGLKAVTMSYFTELQRRIMNGGVFEALKTHLDDINKRMMNWVDTNQEFIEQDLPKYITTITERLIRMAEHTAKTAGVFGRMFGFIGKLFGTQDFNSGLPAHLDRIQSYLREIAGTSWQFPSLGLSGPGQIGGAQTYEAIVEAAKAIERAKKTIPPPAAAPNPAVPSFLGASAVEMNRFRQYDELKTKAKETYESVTAHEMNRFRQSEVLQRDAIDKNKKYFETLAQLSERTAWAMQQNFSDLFFDAMTGKLKSFTDYVKSVLESMQRALADVAGQALTDYLFGEGGGGGGFIGGLFSPTKTRQSGGPISENVVGFGSKTGSQYRFHPNEVVVPSSGQRGVSVDVKVINNTGQQADVRQSSMWESADKMVAEIVLEKQMTSRSFRNSMRR